MNKKTKKFLSLGLLAVLLIGCGKFYESGDLGGLFLFGSDSDDKDFVIVEGAKTLSVAYGRQVLANMVSITGVDGPNEDSKTVFELKVGSLSEDGKATSVNAPMLLAISGLGSEVCIDLIDNYEIDGTRRIFNSVDFGSDPGSFSDANKADVIRRMARSFWGRNETAEEKTMLIGAVNESIGLAGNDLGNADTKDAALYLCTAMISATDAIRL